MTEHPAPLITYKGFSTNLKCRGFQYAIGESYEHTGEVKACKGGFHAMNAYPNVERRDAGPAWMDKTATSEEQILRERAEIWREQEIARVQPAIDAIRNIPQRNLTKDAVIAIVMALSCRIASGLWAKTEAGETAVGTLDDLAGDLEVL